MSTPSRPCQTLSVPPGPAGVDRLAPALAAALDGRGPALALVPESGPASYRSLLRAAVTGAGTVPEEVAVVLATSGSTGNPAGVLLGRDALRAATRGLTARTGAPDGLRWVAVLPLHHAGGLMVLVRSLLTGSTPVPVDSLGGATAFTVAGFVHATDTARTLSAADHRPLAISLVPAMLATLLDSGQAAIEALAAYRLVLIGGAEPPAALIEASRAAGIAVSVSYGMTETCGGAVVDGRPLPGIAVATDPGGRLVLCGDQVGLGYLDGRQPGRWRTGADGRRCFATEDLGRVDPDGRVHVDGRTDDVVQVGGASVGLRAIRAALLDDPRVAAAEVVALPDPRWGSRIVAVVVPTADTPATPQVGAALAERIGARLGRSARPRAVLLRPEIPLLESGKPDRLALRDLAEAATHA